ncbi:MAG TPA: hypothetical protein PK323_05250 [Bacteroidia bacterium]|nr:hypothetical protein [Bacteroidia bacterium]
MPLSAYAITYPDFGENGLYTFITKSGIHYEVMFGRRESNPLHVTVVFGVINDEFDGEEYSETKQHDQYRVMSTVVKIVKHYIESKPHLKLVEFSGVSRDGESEKNSNIRIRFFSRYLKSIFDNTWRFDTMDNKIIAQKKI